MKQKCSKTGKRKKLNTNSRKNGTQAFLKLKSVKKTSLFVYLEKNYRFFSDCTKTRHNPTLTTMSYVYMRQALIF